MTSQTTTHTIWHCQTNRPLFAYDAPTRREAILVALDRRIDLSGADLEGADLQGANLRHTKLDGARLRNANLNGAYLSNATLIDADLSHAILDGATIDDAIVLGGPVTFREFMREVLPALLGAGKLPLEEVVTRAKWCCHSWFNCPMNAVFGVHSLRGVPALWRPHANLFIRLFDGRVLTYEMAREACGLGEAS